MPTKKWEPRVGKLLTEPYFTWAHKCPDGMHGGQPKVDWVGCDIYALFWMVEVKQLPTDRKSINYEKEITAGQRDALSAVADVGGHAILAVGMGTTLYLFTWGRVQWLLQSLGSTLIPLEEASMKMTWTGERAWTNLQNKQRFHQLWALTPELKVRDGGSAGEHTPRIQRTRSRSSGRIAPSPSILKQTGSIRMLVDQGAAESEPSFCIRDEPRSSLESSPTGGGKS